MTRLAVQPSSMITLSYVILLSNSAASVIATLISNQTSSVDGLAGAWTIHKAEAAETRPVCIHLSLIQDRMLREGMSYSDGNILLSITCNTYYALHCISACCLRCWSGLQAYATVGVEPVHEHTPSKYATAGLPAYSYASKGVCAEFADMQRGNKIQAVWEDRQTHLDSESRHALTCCMDQLLLIPLVTA